MKTVLITGAAKGIGRACAIEFMNKGWNVLIHYNKSKEQALKLEKELNAHAFYADITQPSSIENMYEEISKMGFLVDTVVNNASISEECLFSDITTESWDTMFNTNVRGTFLVTKAFLPHMLKKGKGSIVNISSIWGEVGAATEVHYSASKAAIIGMTKALAKELSSSNIRVNCVCPGYVETDMTSHYTRKDKELIFSEIPMGRGASPEEIAKTIEFLASDSSSYTTGQILSVNGGWNI